MISELVIHGKVHILPRDAARGSPPTVTDRTALRRPLVANPDMTGRTRWAAIDHRRTGCRRGMLNGSVSGQIRKL
jgi:hypothetical protein